MEILYVAMVNIFKCGPPSSTIFSLDAKGSNHHISLILATIVLKDFLYPNVKTKYHKKRTRTATI